MQTKKITPRSLYYGTPVALISSRNADGTDNLAPISSSWSLRNSIVLGLGAASQTIANLRRCPELVINLPSAAMWDRVEAISGYTWRSAVPPHKTGQFAFSADKAAIAGMTWQASEVVKPARIAECPIQMEAVCEKMMAVTDEPEGFVIVVAKINLAHAHDDILIDDGSTIDPQRWKPLIFSLRTYHGLDTSLGIMQRAVRG